MTICMAVVGAGRMGSVVAEQLPDSTKKIIIDIDIDKARLLAEKVGGIPSDNLESAAEADVVAIVLPAPVVNETVIKILRVARKGTLVLNMATIAHIDPAVSKINKDVTILDAKIIGHAMSISKGEPGIIVVKCTDKSRFDLIRSQFRGFYKVVQGDADLVETINKIGSIEGLKAAVMVRKKLSQLKIEKEWIDVAVRTVCAGTMKSFVGNDLGHFALELAKKLEKELHP